MRKRFVFLHFFFFFYVLTSPRGNKFLVAYFFPPLRLPNRVPHDEPRLSIDSTCVSFFVRSEARTCRTSILIVSSSAFLLLLLLVRRLISSSPALDLLPFSLCNIHYYYFSLAPVPEKEGSLGRTRGGETGGTRDGEGGKSRVFPEAN